LRSRRARVRRSPVRPCTMRVCHRLRPLQPRSGADPVRAYAATCSARGSRVVEAVGEGVSAARRRSRRSHSSRAVPECVHCRATRTNPVPPSASSKAGIYLPTDDTPHARGDPNRHFMGHPLAEYHLMRNRASAKVNSRPARSPGVLRLRLSTAPSAPRSHEKVGRARDVRRPFAPGLVGLGAVAGCRLRGRADQSPSISRSSGSTRRRCQGATRLSSRPDTI